MQIRRILVVLSLLFLTTVTSAQVPRVLNYQGALTDASGQIVDQQQLEVTFELYDAPTGGTFLWGEKQTLDVKDGVLDADLGKAEPIKIEYDGPLYLSVSIDGSELLPRTQLTAAPYSLHALSVADGSVSATSLREGAAVRSINDLTDAVTLEAGDNVTIVNDENALIISTSTSGASLPPEIRLQANDTSPNLVIGYSENSVVPGTAGATISGGGSETSEQTFDFGFVGTSTVLSGGPNKAESNYATIGGGSGNRVSAVSATVGGGHRNRVGDGASAATIAGGNRNQVSASHGFVGGGDINLSLGRYSSVVGGKDNRVRGKAAFVGGGRQNEVIGESSAISGGKHNVIEAAYATVAGGGGELNTEGNRVYDDYGSIGGGRLNVAGSDDSDSLSAQGATVAGGRFNVADASSSTVAGGFENKATARRASVSGGEGNEASKDGATIGGGNGNLADGLRSVIAGGFINRSSEIHSVVSGGRHNTASGSHSTVGGGGDNIAAEEHATVPGGWENEARGQGSLAAGTRARAIHRGSFVWSDRPSDLLLAIDSLLSTEDNQFLVRARGGAVFTGDTDAMELRIEADRENSGEDDRASLVLSQDGGGVIGRLGYLLDAPNDNDLVLRNEHGSSRLHLGTAGENRLTIDSDGNVIVNGQTVHASDERLKRDVEPLDGALDGLASIRGVSYAWKDPGRNSGREIGVLAQEVEAAFPELVHEAKDGTKHVAYEKLSAVLIEAVKELQGMVRERDGRLARVEARMNRVESILKAATSPGDLRNAATTASITDGGNNATH